MSQAFSGTAKNFVHTLALGCLFVPTYKDNWSNVITDLGKFVFLPVFFILLPTPFPLMFFKQAELRGENEEGESPHPPGMTRRRRHFLCCKAMSSWSVLLLISVPAALFLVLVADTLAGVLLICPCFPPRAICMWKTPVTNSQRCLVLDCYHLKQIAYSRSYLPFLPFLNRNFHCVQWDLCLTTKSIIWKGRKIYVIVLWSLLWHSFSNVAQDFFSTVLASSDKIILINKIVWFLSKILSVNYTWE